MQYKRLLKKISPMMRGKDIESVQERLNSLGFNCGIVDGYYGKNTEKSVKNFQSSKKLVVDGIIGPNTWKQLFLEEGQPEKCEKIKFIRVLKKTSPMMNGDDIKSLQKRLNGIGFDCGIVDGYFGSKTDVAVRKFQIDRGLLIDGIVRAEVWKALFEENNNDESNLGGHENKLLMPIHGIEAGYLTDTGLDIAAPVGTECYASASGRIIYSEYGHTRWRTPPDTPYSILIELDEPFVFEGKFCRYIWYTHLSELRYQVPDGSQPRHVEAGEVIGKSGLGNRNAHLHFGVIVNRAQRNENDYLTMLQVRRLLGIIKGQRV